MMSTQSNSEIDNTLTTTTNDSKLNKINATNEYEQANQTDDITAEEQALIDKKLKLQEHSQRIKEIADTQADSALKCIHMISVAGGATNGTYKSIERRIVKDQDTYGAYHLALMSQSTPDLPIDTRQLIEMVTNYGDNDQLLALLRNLPIPPVERIKQRIVASNDGEAIGKMNAYLQSNPDGYGSQVTLASGQKDRIVPLSEG